MEGLHNRYLIVGDDGPAQASADTYEGAVTACLWLESQEETSAALTGSRFRIVDTAAGAEKVYDADGVQICKACSWPKGWDRFYVDGLCPECDGERRSA